MTRRLARVPAALRTLRFRVTALATVAVLAVLSAVSVGVVLQQRATLTAGLDEALTAQAGSLVAQLRNGTADPETSDDDFGFQLVTPDGTLVGASTRLAGQPVWDVPHAPGSSIVTADVDGEIGDARLLSLPYREDTLHVVADLDDVADSTTALAGSLVAAVPLSALVLALVVWWAVGRSLRPVESIRAEVDRISGRDLDRRVPEPASDDEIARLARTMNAMLDRLHASSERQRRFVADASHELRSPLTRMRSELEVDLAHPATARPKDTEGSVLTEVVGLQSLVDDLLLLARGDAGALDVRHPSTVDLDHVVDEVAGHAEAAGTHRRVPVDRTGVEPVQVAGDAAQLRRAVSNLIDNALRHAASGVRVTLGESGGGWAELRVSDDGPGIPEGLDESVFERFTRIDGARSAADGGAGLGLAIARDVARRHGGSLTLERDAGATPGDGGACFLLRLPLTTR